MLSEDEKRKLVSLITQIIMQAVPEATTQLKYGGTLFTIAPDKPESQFCGIFCYRGHVQLSFARGTDLKDPQGVLLGGGKHRRHLNYTECEEVDAALLKRLLQEAAALT